MQATQRRDHLADARVTGWIDLGTRGQWSINQFEVRDSDLLLQMNDMLGRAVPAGTYTRLQHAQRGVVMSDTRAELRDLAPLFYSMQPQGRGVVNGLGLGCVLKALLSMPEVEHVDVVEIDPDVIALVEPTFRRRFGRHRYTIHQHDAFTMHWPKGTRWDFAWHDVWDNLCSDNLSNEQDAVPGTYARLNRMYGRRVRVQGAWGQEFLRAEARRERGWW